MYVPESNFIPGIDAFSEFNDCSGSESPTTTAVCLVLHGLHANVCTVINLFHCQTIAIPYCLLKNPFKKWAFTGVLVCLMSLKSLSLKYLVDVLRVEGSIAPMYCFFSSSSCSNQIDFVLLDKIAN